jgi:polar amino acid transport system permease protein
MKDFDLLAILLKPEFSTMLLHGLKTTLWIAAGSWILAMALALVLLTARLTPSRVAERAVEAYVSYHRNVPTLVQMMLWYFGIASLLPTAAQTWLSDHSAEALFAVVSLGLCQAAYFCEDLRSGFRAVPPGQAEAARALGHSYIGAMRHVLMPQAVRNAIPALVNHSVSLFKNSSLAMAIGAAELTHVVKELESRTFRAFESYLIATILYLAISLVIMAIGAWLARRSSLATARQA